MKWHKISGHAIILTSIVRFVCHGNECYSCGFFPKEVAKEGKGCHREKAVDDVVLRVCQFPEQIARIALFIGLAGLLGTS